jgi:transposase-like protein
MSADTVSDFDVLHKGSDDAQLFLYLAKLRWGKTVACPLCRKRRNWELRSRLGWWQCAKCHRNFSAITGTLFGATRLPIRKWLRALEVVLSEDSRVVPVAILRAQADLGSQQTAWEIRRLLAGGQDFDGAITTCIKMGRLGSRRVPSLEETLRAILKLPKETVAAIHDQARARQDRK